MIVVYENLHQFEPQADDTFRMTWATLHSSVFSDGLCPKVGRFFSCFDHALLAVKVKFADDDSPLADLIDLIIESNCMLRFFICVDDLFFENIKALGPLSWERQCKLDLALSGVMRNIQERLQSAPDNINFNLLKCVLLTYWGYLVPSCNCFIRVEVNQHSELLMLALLQRDALVGVGDFIRLYYEALCELVPDSSLAVERDRLCSLDGVDVMIPPPQPRSVMIARIEQAVAQEEALRQSDPHIELGIILNKAAGELDTHGANQILLQYFRVDQLDFGPDYAGRYQDIQSFDAAFQRVLAHSSAMVRLNKHRRPDFDWCIGLHNTRHWQHTVRKLRESAYQCLNAQLSRLSILQEKIDLCHEALQMDVFKRHRSNFVIFGAFGNTNHTAMIREQIKEFEAEIASQFRGAELV